MDVCQPRVAPTDQACKKMFENPVVSGRNKHVENDCHFVRDHHELGNIEVVMVSTKDQQADILTKNLPRPLFEHHVSNLLNKGGDRLESEGDC